MGYKKSLFLEKKGFLGFQEIIGGDDDLFVNRYAKSSMTSVVVGKEALVFSTPKSTWRSYFRQKHRHLSVGKHYRSKTKFMLGLFQFSWILFYLLIPATILGMEFNPIILSTILGGRLVLALTCFYIASRRFGNQFGLPGILLLDVVYPFYYIFVGAKATFIKTVSWE